MQSPPESLSPKASGRPSASAASTAGAAGTGEGAVDAPAAAGSSASLAGRVQVLLEDGWHDSPPEEVTQVFRQIAGGQTRFTLATTRGMYIIEMQGKDGATQTHVHTKKSRKMRILEDSAPQSPRERARFELQEKYGPQSKRGNAPQQQLEVIANDPHAVACFETLFKREEELCGDWAVFYHSYSLPALIYEVHAAVANMLFGFDSSRSTLPRLLVKDFAQTPDAGSLIKRFNDEFITTKKDHCLEYRKAAISVMCSLVSLGPECSIPILFRFGYSEKDVPYQGVLDNLLEACHVPKGKTKKVAKSIIALCDKYGLDVSQFGGKKRSNEQNGHMLQIFVRRRFLDDIAYASAPYGDVDSTRHPISKWLGGDAATHYGQARVVANPTTFLSDKCVRMYSAHSDPEFHANRGQFQLELIKLLRPLLGEGKTRERVATTLYGGVLPAWWKDDAS